MPRWNRWNWTPAVGSALALDRRLTCSHRFALVWTHVSFFHSRIHFAPKKSISLNPNVIDSLLVFSSLSARLKEKFCTENFVSEFERLVGFKSTKRFARLHANKRAYRLSGEYWSDKLYSFLFSSHSSRCTVPEKREWENFRLNIWILKIDSIAQVRQCQC